MAMQAANPAAMVPTAQVVGNAFVEQYYHILHQSPGLVHKFYQDSSVISRPDANGIMTSVTTMQAIDDKIQSLDYKNYKAEIRTADAQDSYEAGVIVLVTGYLTGTDNVKRKFTQTFFLAPQEKGYFVLNDIFRYVEESESLEDNSASANGINDNATIPMTPDSEPIDESANPDIDPSTTLETEDLHNGAEVCDPSDNEEGSVIEEEVVNEPPNHSIQNETLPVSPETPATEEKKSYASIVKVTKVSTPSTFVYVPRGPPANSDPQSHNTAKASFEPEASAPTSDNIPESGTAHEEVFQVEGHSIYVRNLPLDATPAQLDEVFKQFGPIGRGGIQVRNNKGFCFGFVEFESVGSMQNAIKASPVTVGGRQAVVEEKRTTTRVGSGPRVRFPSGRGFRSDSFRGRGNLGGGRGYGRIEFRNQGDLSGRPRGPTSRNAESYQRVNQNEGARSSHQGG